MDSLNRCILAATLFATVCFGLSGQALVRPVLAVSKDFKIFAVTNPEGDLQVREVSTGELLAFRPAGRALYRELSFGSDPLIVEILLDNGTRGSWNWSTGRWASVPASAFRQERQVAVGTLLIAADQRGVSGRDTGTGKIQWSALNNEEILALGADSERWAAGTSSGRVFWGRVSDGIIEQSRSTGHGPVAAVVNTGNRRWIILSADFSLELWDGNLAQILGRIAL